MVSVDRSHTAVLVMDFQTGILGRLGDAATPVVERAAAVVGAARGAGVPVIYVVLGFRPGYPEVNARNSRFVQLTQSGRFVNETPGADVHPTLKPDAGDAVVVKHRVGAFTGTDLDMLLRAKSIDTLILLGISTSGVVLSTVRHGSDADYRLLVVRDGCADADPEVHRVLMDKVLVTQATVLSSAEVMASFQ